MDLDAYFTERSQRGRLRGAVLVRQHGQTLLDHGYGSADTGRPNVPGTVFQIASNSKQFTAAAILLLAEEGRLAVDDHIERWLPAYPAGWAPITVHQLLTHTSGIGHWRDYPDLSPYQPATREHLLHTFFQRPLSFVPGGGWAYSSPAYVLLAHIVERVAGVPYAAFLRERIFLPLGMDDTGAGNRAPHPEREARGYAGKRLLPSLELDTVNMGAGDIWSTTHDLARWDSALAAPGLLREASLRAMLTPHALTVGFVDEIPGTRYGYGLCLADMEGKQLRFHPGDNSGYVSLNVVLPESDGVFILLANDEDTDLTGISLDVLHALLSG